MVGSGKLQRLFKQRAEQAAGGLRRLLAQRAQRLRFAPARVELRPGALPRRLIGRLPGDDAARPRGVPVYPVAVFVHLRYRQAGGERLVVLQAQRFADLQRKGEHRLAAAAHGLDVVEISAAQ